VLDRSAGQRLSLSSDPLLRLQEMTTDPTELAFIRRLDGNRQVDDILKNAEIPGDKARLLLVALLESGMIERSETTSRRRSVPAPAAPPPEPEGVPSPTPPPATGPLSTGQLEMMLQTARTQDFFWVLGVEQNATTAEVDRAYEALARSFHADRYRLATEEDRKSAQEVFERLTEAHRTLRDGPRRRAYATKLARTTAPEAAAAAPAVESPATPATVDGAPAASSSNAAARALYDAGLSHLRARRHHEAVEALRQAARLVPNEADYRAALGWALFRQAPADARAGRAAVAELRRALQIDERNRNAAQRLAEIYAQTGQPELAVQELERLLALHPDDMEVADELRRLRAR
jgi:tetratricopeptide (TPR) repeat protein